MSLFYIEVIKLYEWGNREFARMLKLRDCPICGEKVILSYNHHNGKYYIRCDDCGFRLYNKVGETYLELVDRYND